MADQPGFRITFNITPDTLADAGRLYQPWPYRVTAALGIAFLLIGLLMVAGVLYAADRTANYPGPAIFFVLLGILFLTPLIWRAPIRWLNAWYARGVIGKPMTLLLQEDGIAAETPITTAFIPWSSITGIRWNERVVIGLSDRLLVWYAPTAALGTPERQAEIIALVQRHIVDANMAIGRLPAGVKVKEVGKDNE